MSRRFQRSFGRARFWGCGLLLWVVGIAIIEGLAGAVGPEAAAAGAAALLVASTWLCLLRLRDRQRSAAWMLLLLLPLIGPLWLVVELGLRRGTLQTNRP